MVPLVIDKDLGLILEAAEGGGMNDTVAVALEDRSKFVFFLRPLPSTRIPASHSVGSESPFLLNLDPFPPLLLHETKITSEP